MGNSFRPTYRGQTSKPAFYETSKSVQYKQSNSNSDAVGRVEIVVIVFGLVALGVVVMAMGHRQVVHTTPIIQAVPSREADASRITNIINTVDVLAAHRQMSASQTPPA